MLYQWKNLIWTRFIYIRRKLWKYWHWLQIGMDFFRSIYSAFIIICDEETLQTCNSAQCHISLTSGKDSFHIHRTLLYSHALCFVYCTCPCKSQRILVPDGWLSICHLFFTYFDPNWTVWSQSRIFCPLISSNSLIVKCDIYTGCIIWKVYMCNCTKGPINQTITCINISCQNDTCPNAKFQNIWQIITCTFHISWALSHFATRSIFFVICGSDLKYFVTWLDKHFSIVRINPIVLWKNMKHIVWCFVCRSGLKWLTVFCR